MTLPLQCVAACSRTGRSNEWLLFSASGPRLYVQSTSGAHSEWPVEEPQVRTQEQEQADEVQERPGKRIKLTPAPEQKANFSVLRPSNDRKHLVAVTAEDKCIRVFQVDSECRLQQLSQRCMARRPCSITLTPDDSTILCADKFGDVYALPLLPSPEDEQNGSAESEKSDKKKFVPSASALTVHSGRNRKTLEEQMKQAEKGPSQAKEAPTFKHDLLLGHVSMLTDIAYAVVDSRSYIVTADRDEHIRVSRGPPQAHIIEGFCQGHEKFISRLCLTKSGQLVSGGGDPHLFVWDWLRYRVLQKLPIRDAVLSFYKSHSVLASSLPKDEESFKVAVSGIWNVPEVDEILVACEGVPALFGFKIGASSTSATPLPLNGNALDVAFMNPNETSCTAVVSVDHLHKPGSTTKIRGDEAVSRLQFWSYQDGQWAEDSKMVEAFQCFGGDVTGSRNAGSDRASGATGLADVDEKALRDMLYSVENLRKRPGAED